MLLEVLDNFCCPVSQFWGSSLSPCCNGTDNVSPDAPVFTLCFEDTALLYGVCCSFWVAAGLRLLCTVQRKPKISINWLNTLKLILIAVSLITTICDLLFTVHQSKLHRVAYFQYLTPSAIMITMILAAIVIYFERLYGVRASVLMFILWGGLLIYGTLKLWTFLQTSVGSITDKFRFTTFCFLYFSIFVEFILSLVPDHRQTGSYHQLCESERKCSLEEDATFMSKLTWWWLNGLVRKGWKKPLLHSDLTDLNSEDKSQVIAPKFQDIWDKEIKKTDIYLGHNRLVDVAKYQPLRTEPSTDPRTTTRQQKEPSLLLALSKTLWRAMAMAAVFKLGQDVLGFVSPQILRLLINFASDPDEPAWRGYFYAVLLLLTAVIQSLLLQQYFYRCSLVGMRIRTALTTAVYRKSFCLSSKARRTSTVGEIVNLMAVDTQRLMDLMTMFHMIWSAPLQIILALVFLWFALGPSIFAGFGVMLLLLPVTAVIAAFSKRYQVQQMIHKDTRVKLINEVLNGIKVIKMYAWETPFKQYIMDIRNAELKVLKKLAYTAVVSSLTWFCAPFMVTLITFGTFALAHKDDSTNRLTADRVFVALSLFNILRFPLYMFPVIISQFVQASVSVKRLGKFLKSEELDSHCVIWTSDPADGHEDAVAVTDGSFTWEEIERPTLSNLNFRVGQGQLVAVVGQVGAGKSSLISALLGEMERVEGSVTLKGSVAYVSQQAWIMNATLRDNVLFGTPMNTSLYNTTLQACALEPDLNVIGDLTEIGEKGINLSGGQKQRVSLARAIYQQADIYLLDDTLSAVDTHVGRHIFESVIGPQGLLKRKARVLVTHGVTYLPQCDHIIVMRDGRIAEQGSYSELVESNGAFAEFLHTFATVDTADVKASGLDGSLGILKVTSKGQDSSALNVQNPRGTKLDKQSQSGGVTGQLQTRNTVTPEQATLITEEKAESGTVKLSVIKTYCKACTYWTAVLLMLFQICLHALSVGSNFWLAKWSNAESTMSRNSSTNVGYHLGIYSALGLGQAIFVILAVLALALATITGSRTLHTGMLANILHCPMSFFDTTPIGRILNRFSKDIYTIDEVIPRSLDDFFLCLFTVVDVIIVVAIVTPIFIVVIFPLGVFYWLVQRFYVSTSRQLKRLDSITRSPIYSHFQESITGASTIRAYHQQDRFILESMSRVDYNHIVYYPSFCANRWLAVRLEMIGHLIVLFAALFATIQRNHSEELNLASSAGLVGLSITYALQVTQELNWLVRQTSELETNIIAVERTKEYSEISTEAPPVIETNRPSPSWPSDGCIRFDHFSTCYREGLDFVLQDITVQIPGRAKVGIVGRTGAGKSSVVLSLLRIIEAASGSIRIDGVDISTIGLYDLRSRITTIPQDPVLFSGTLRANLDPFDAHSDEEVWRALESAHLSSFVATLNGKLQHVIIEGGENLSVGQRQLVCLARALLRNTRILVLDEATAAVDLETDDLIQKTIRVEFADCTVLTIAHRIHTIMDYDYVMVFQEGRIVEYDTPQALLSNKEQFYTLARSAGLVS